MPLNDLNKELYNPTSADLANRRHEQSEYDPLAGKSTIANPFEQQEQWHPVQKGLSPAGKKKLQISLSILGVVIVATAGIFFYRWWLKNAFHQDRVAVTFEGPKEADSTQPIKYLIHYKNNNRVKLKNAEVQLKYPENFQPTDNVNLKFLSPTSSKIFIGDIKSMSEGETELKGIFYAPKDFPVYIRAELHFVPSNGSQELAMNDQIGVNITAAPVILDISAPQQIVSGDLIEYNIDYKNLDFRQISGAQVRLDLPQGFQMRSSDPKPSEKDSFWYLGNLEANQGGRIKIQGLMKGEDGDNKTVVASFGHVGQDDKFIVFNKREVTTNIVSPILRVEQILEGKSDDVFAAGEMLKYTIAYQNTGNIGLRDSIISAEIKGKVLNFAKINTMGGAFDSSKGVITWKASEVPGLANINPKSGGKVQFTIPVKEIIPIDNRLDKNFVVSSIAKIDSPDIPTPIDSNKIIGTDRLELKLASKVLFDTRGYYNDAKIKNTGPIPLETGKETTFTLHWIISNISNDISDVKVVSSLPTGVRWRGKVFPANEKITYNERTNQIIWDAGNISAGAGVLEAPREIAFQVSVVPQINQIGQALTLLNKSTMNAKDIFVEKEINLEGIAKDTQLAEDKGVGFTYGKVVR